MNDYYEFLALLKQGDTYIAAITYNRYSKIVSLIRKITIDKVSKTSLWANGERYNRKNGEKHGDRSVLLPRKATQVEIDAFECKELKAEAIKLLQTRTVTKDKLHQIVDLLTDA